MWLELLGIGCTTRSAVVLEPMTNALSVKSVAVMVAYSWPSRSTISLRTLACISSSFDSGQSVHSCNIRKLSREAGFTIFTGVFPSSPISQTPCMFG